MRELKLVQPSSEILDAKFNKLRSFVFNSGDGIEKNIPHKEARVISAIRRQEKINPYLFCLSGNLAGQVDYVP